MPAQRVIDYTAYLVVRTLICTIQALPLGMCDAIARKLGWFVWHVVRLRRKVVEENLAIAFPEKSLAERNAVALAMWRHLFLMVMEIAHAPRKVHRTNWREHSYIADMKQFLAPLLQGRPVVIISGHLGNFELGGYLLALHGFPTHTIARRLDNPYLDEFVNSFRGATGQYMLPKEGSSQAIANILVQGGALVLLGDQHAGNNACWVDFFGKPASTHKAVAVFTLSGNAPTVVCAALRHAPLMTELRVSEWVDPADPQFQLGTIPLLTGWYTRCLEQLIRVAPDQYWWVHRRWKGSPHDRRSQRRRSQSLAA